ncbi:MAG: radical SAM protein [Acidobacteriota bacterium]
MVKLNPGELQLDLFCKGIRIDESCTLDKDARLFARTRAGLGSGLEVIIPGKLKDIWTNIPVEEDFAQNSPYLLKKIEDDYFVIDERNNLKYLIKIPEEPRWYNEKTSSETLMSMIGVMQGTYLGIYVSNSCGFWYYDPPMNCKFCTTGLNVGVNEVAEKKIEDVVETATRAKEESKITFVHLNSGYNSGRDAEVMAPYVKALKEEVGVLVGVQLIPPRELWKIDWLIDLGADHFSYCYEFHNPEYFEKFLPGKFKLVRQKTFFDALEHTSKKMGKGKASGEIIAGVEPIEDTLKAIDYITDTGAFPTVCIFRPVIGADMEDFPSPSYEDMYVVFRYLYKSCIKKNIPTGIVPNIEVSLVVLPADAKYLVERDLRYYIYNFKMNVLKILAKPYFKYKMKKRKINIPLDPMEWKEKFY